MEQTFEREETNNLGRVQKYLIDLFPFRVIFV